MSQQTASPFSLEFFPPRDAAAQERLVAGARRMLVMRPQYVSVTFGAGGSTREGTLETVRTMRELGCDATPHLACIGSSREELRALLHHYQESGIRRIVALRGDLPSGMGLDAAGALRHAGDLVEFIRAETGDWFHIEVAAYPEMHPQAAGPSQDLDHFVRKVKAGANGAYTGRADDVVGEASGQVSGNAFRWGYTLALPVDGRVWHVDFDDWMYLMDNRVMLNKATMSKWGVKLGEVTLSFTRRTPLEGVPS
jgi:hypothetical protein